MVGRRRDAYAAYCRDSRALDQGGVADARIRTWRCERQHPARFAGMARGMTTQLRCNMGRLISMSQLHDLACKVWFSEWQGVGRNKACRGQDSTAYILQ